jgi:hypothetical protein
METRRGGNNERYVYTTPGFANVSQVPGRDPAAGQIMRSSGSWNSRILSSARLISALAAAML